MIGGDGRPRPAASGLAARLAALSSQELDERQKAAEQAIVSMGITFTVYSEGQNIDRAWPFDIVPRTLARTEWSRIETGLKQRLRALNHFIDDIYHDQRIVRDGRFPREVFESSKNFLPACVGANPAHGVWANICGTDLVRDKDGTMYVLEDNLRVPSGVSYMLEDRKVMMRLFPELFARYDVEPVEHYPDILLDNEPSEVLAGRDPQLEKGVEVLLEALKSKPAAPQVPPEPDKSKDAFRESMRPWRARP